MEPTTTSFGGYIIAKGAAAIAGLFGGLSISMFWQPKQLHKHGKLAAGAWIGAISVGAAVALSGLIAHWIGLDYREIDVVLGLGYLLGMVGVGFIGWVANFLERQEGADIVDVYQRVKEPLQSVKKPLQRYNEDEVEDTPPVKRKRSTPRRQLRGTIND